MNRISASKTGIAATLVVLGAVGTTHAGATPARLVSQANAAACTAQEARATWGQFLAAFSSGDYERLNALVADEPDFLWFSSNTPGLRARRTAEDRSSLSAYFQSRHAARDRLALLEFAYHGQGNFTYTLQRSASDYAHGAQFRVVGKGSLTCSPAGVRLIVVSIGAPGSDRPAPRCKATRATRANRPPATVPRSFDYGGNKIAVALNSPDGRLVAGRLPQGGIRATINADGSIDAKYGWWRAGPEKIQISGRRTDAAAPRLKADIPNGYSSGFQATKLTFPRPGCWRVTGRVPHAKLSFTVLVTLSPLVR